MCIGFVSVSSHAYWLSRMIFDIYCQEVSENACACVWTWTCMKLVSVCMSLRGWSQTLYLFADKCHRLQLLGGLCCRVGERGQTGGACAAGGVDEASKWGVGSQTVGKGGWQHDHAESNQQAPQWQSRFHDPSVHLSFPLSQSALPPSPHPLFPFREKQRKGGCTPQSS